MKKQRRQRERQNQGQQSTKMRFHRTGEGGGDEGKSGGGGGGKKAWLGAVDSRVRPSCGHTIRKNFLRSFLWRRCSSILPRFRPRARTPRHEIQFSSAVEQRVRERERESVWYQRGTRSRADQLAPNLRMASNKKANVISWLVQANDEPRPTKCSVVAGVARCLIN